MKYEVKLRTHSLAVGGGGAHLRLVELEFVAEENHTPGTPPSPYNISATALYPPKISPGSRLSVRLRRGMDSSRAVCRLARPGIDERFSFRRLKIMNKTF